MTVEKLSQLRYLKHEIEVERERLLELRRLSEYGEQRMDGTPRANGKSDRVSRFAIELTYLEQLIAEQMQWAVCELLRLQKFINDIEDSELRLIFYYRYIKCLGWKTVAFRMGKHDEQLPRKKHDRYLKMLAEKQGKDS